MLVGNEFDVSTKFLEDSFVFHAFAVFHEGDEIDFMFAREFAQQMKRALIRPAVELVGDVWIKNENFHGSIKPLPQFEIRAHEAGEIGGVGL